MSVSGIRMGRAFVEIGADLSPLGRALHGAKGMLQGWGNQLMGIGSSMLRTGLMMAGALTPAIMQFADYEQALADLRAAAGPDLGNRFEDIKAKIEDIAKSTGLSPVEVTQAFSELIKAGKSVDEVIGGLGETVVKFARVSGMTTAETAVVLSDALNVFGGSAMQAANIMNQAADASTISLKDVADAFAQGGSVAGMFGQTMLDTATAIAIMGNAGIKGAQAGTALKTFLTRVATGVAENGTDEVAQAMRRLGLNARDANGRLLPLPDLLARIQEGLATMTPAEQDQTIKQLAGMRGLLGLAPLLKTGAQGFLDFQSRMSSALTVEEKFNVMTDTLWGQLKRLWVHLQFVAIAIGEALAPALRAGTMVLLPFLDGLANFLKSNQHLAQSFAFDAVKAIVFGAALLALGVIINGVAFAIGGLLTGISAIAAIVGGIASAVGFLFTPWGAALLAIGAAVVGLIAYFGEWDSSLSFFANVVNLFKQFGSFLHDIWKRFTASPFGEFMAKALKAAVAVAAIAAALMMITGEWLMSGDGGFLDNLLGLMQELWAFSVRTFEFLLAMGQQINAPLGMVMDFLAGIGQAVQDQLGVALDATAARFSELFDRLFATGTQAWTAIRDAFAAGDWNLAFNVIGLAARSMVNDLSFFLTATFYTWKDALTDAFMSAWHMIKTGFLKMWAEVKAVSFEGIAQILEGLASAAVGPAKDLLNAQARGYRVDAQRERQLAASAASTAYQITDAERLRRLDRDLALEGTHAYDQERLQMGLDFASYDASNSSFWQNMLGDDQAIANFRRELRDMALADGRLGEAEEHQDALNSLADFANDAALMALDYTTPLRTLAPLPDMAGATGFGTFGSFSGNAISAFGMASPAERAAAAAERSRDLLQQIVGLDETGNELLERLVDENGVVAD